MKLFTVRKLRHRPGSLYVDFRLGGKRHCIALGTLDRRAAVLRAEEVYRHAVHNAPSHAPAASVQHFLGAYRPWADTQKPRSTRSSEETALRRFTQFLESRKIVNVRDISPAVVDAFVQHLAVTPVHHRFRNGEARSTGRTMQPATIHSYCGILSAVFRMAKRWKYCDYNPFHDVPLPRYEKPEPRSFTVEEVKAILRQTAVHSPECLDVFLLYFVTGLRASEALRLEWDDVLFEAGEIRARRTKGRKPRRIPMGGIARRILQSRRHLPKPFPPVQRVHTLRHRVRTFDRHFVGREFKRMAELAGVKGAMLKQSRSTFTTALLEIANVSTLAAQKIVGHASIETTNQHYFNQISEDVKRKVAAIDAVFEEILPETVTHISPPSG